MVSYIWMLCYRCNVGKLNHNVMNGWRRFFCLYAAFSPNIATRACPAIMLSILCERKRSITGFHTFFFQWFACLANGFIYFNVMENIVVSSSQEFHWNGPLSFSLSYVGFMTMCSAQKIMSINSY